MAQVPLMIAAHSCPLQDLSAARGDYHTHWALCELLNAPSSPQSAYGFVEAGRRKASLGANLRSRHRRAIRQLSQCPQHAVLTRREVAQVHQAPSRILSRRSTPSQRFYNPAKVFGSLWVFQVGDLLNLLLGFALAIFTVGLTD